MPGLNFSTWPSRLLPAVVSPSPFDVKLGAFINGDLGLPAQFCSGVGAIEATLGLHDFYAVSIQERQLFHVAELVYPLHQAAPDVGNGVWHSTADPWAAHGLYHGIGKALEPNWFRGSCIIGLPYSFFGGGSQNCQISDVRRMYHGVSRVHFSRPEYDWKRNVSIDSVCNKPVSRAVG